MIFSQILPSFPLKVCCRCCLLPSPVCYNISLFFYLFCIRTTGVLCSSGGGVHSLKPSVFCCWKHARMKHTAVSLAAWTVLLQRCHMCRTLRGHMKLNRLVLDTKITHAPTNREKGFPSATFDALSRAACIAKTLKNHSSNNKPA